MKDEQKKIMIVEDETLVARDLSSRLSERGYNVVYTTSVAEEAVSKVQELNPDLILMDIKLEGNIDGIAAGEEIYNSYSIPIVYLTAHKDESLLKRTQKSRPYGYILKPFDPENLFITIEIALLKHSFERQIVEETENAIATIIGCVELLIEEGDIRNNKTISRLKMIRNSADIIKTKINQF